MRSNHSNTDWRAVVAPYEVADNRRAGWQLATTLGPLLLVSWLAWHALSRHVALAVPLILVGAGLLVRAFIIQHDCGHGSFLSASWANDLIGRLCSLLTFTPYQAWRRDHAVHHATAGNLDHRGTGDIRTLTVNEYLALPLLRRYWYRIYRHPLGLFVIGPFYHFVLAQRFTFGLPRRLRRERLSVHVTNLALVLFYGWLAVSLGWRPLVLVLVPMTVIASSAGVWLFYVQHQFDEAYWQHQPDWSYREVALQGSSYYKLPKILQWFTGNIGLHHVHHLSPRIPNYRLQQCHNENPIFHQALTMGLIDSLRTIPLALWDEANQRLIRFSDLDRRLRLSRAA